MGYVAIGIWYNDKWVDDPDGFYRTFDPTHWMPLPEPPNENNMLKYPELQPTKTATMKRYKKEQQSPIEL